MLMAKVLKKYEICYPNPLILKVGDRVKILKKVSYPQWLDWYYCKAPDGSEGWISKNYLSNTADNAEIINPYNAIELDANPGDDMVLLFEDND